MCYNYRVEGSQAFLFAGQIAAILLMSGSLDKNPAEQSGGYLIGGKMIGINTHCAICGEPITASRQFRNAIYCSYKCSQAAGKNRFLENFQGKSRQERSTASVGAMHELLVCYELLRLGLHVFRAQSPSCPCDLIAMNNGTLYRIEVTTGNRGTHNNNISYPAHKNGIFDFIAVCFHDGEIRWYSKDGNQIDLLQVITDEKDI